MSELSENNSNGAITAEPSFVEAVASIKDYAIFALDPGGHVRTWNEGARRIKQYAHHEIIGKHFSIFYMQTDQDKDHPAFELDQALKNGSYEEEGWRLRKDGSAFWAGVTITPITNGAAGFIKVTRDLTERRRYETAIEYAKDQALAANRAQSSFVANVTHELRTPLTSIVGLSELFANDDGLDSDRRRAATVMFESSKLLLRMLNDLLDHAKLEAGKMQVARVPYSLKKVLSDVLELVRVKSDAKGLTLSTDVSENLPDVQYGDPFKIRQIILNLVDNAIKFTDFGGISISAEPDQNHLLISVTDTGIGVPEEQQNQLFVPFSQLHSQTEKYKGTGLGLAISSQYVQLLGGKMGLVSEKDKGTTFWFVVPANEEQFIND